MTHEQGTEMLSKVNLTDRQLELLSECLGKGRAVIADSIEAMQLTDEQQLKLIEFITQIKAEG